MKIFPIYCRKGSTVTPPPSPNSFDLDDQFHVDDEIGLILFYDDYASISSSTAEYLLTLGVEVEIGTSIASADLVVTHPDSANTLSGLGAEINFSPSLVASEDDISGTLGFETTLGFLSDYSVDLSLAIEDYFNLSESLYFEILLGGNLSTSSSLSLESGFEDSVSVGDALTASLTTNISDEEFLVDSEVGDLTVSLGGSVGEEEGISGALEILSSSSVGDELSAELTTLLEEGVLVGEGSLASELLVEEGLAIDSQTSLSLSGAFEEIVSLSAFFQGSLEIGEESGLASSFDLSALLGESVAVQSGILSTLEVSLEEDVGSDSSISSTLSLPEEMTASSNFDAEAVFVTDFSVADSLNVDLEVLESEFVEVGNSLSGALSLPIESVELSEGGLEGILSIGESFETGSEGVLDITMINVADSWTNQGSGNQNNGGDTTLHARAPFILFLSAIRRMYIKFDFTIFSGLEEIPGDSDLVIDIWVAGGAFTDNLEFRSIVSASDPWNEFGITWNNAPTHPTVEGVIEVPVSSPTTQYTLTLAASEVGDVLGNYLSLEGRTTGALGVVDLVAHSRENASGNYPRISFSARIA